MGQSFPFAVPTLPVGSRQSAGNFLLCLFFFVCFLNRDVFFSFKKEQMVE